MSRADDRPVVTRARWCCVLLAVVQGWSMASNADAVLSTDMVLNLVTNSNVTLSADGKRVAWQMTRPPEGAQSQRYFIDEVWSAAVDAPDARVRESGSGSTRPRWSPNGKQLAWLQSAEPGGAVQVRVKTLASGDVRALTDAPGGVVAFEWSPKGDRIAYTAWDGISAEQQREHSEGRDWIVYDEPRSQLRLYVADLATGKHALVTRAEMSVHYFSWSPRGDQLVIAAASTASADDEMLRTRPYVVDAAGATPRLLADHYGRLAYPSWSADGKWIAWLASIDVSDAYHGNVFVMPAEGGVAPKNLTDRFAGTATWLGTWPGHDAAFVFRSLEGQATNLHALDVNGNVKLLDAPDAILSGTPSFAADGRRWATTANTPKHPDEVFMAHTAGRAAIRRLTDSNPQLHSVRLGEQQVTRWRSKDGLPIEGVVIRPVDYRAGTRYPVVVHVHGGSESVIENGWRGTYRDWGQLLAARGYLVIYPNYRGSIGRGAAFVSGNRRDLMGREWEDIEAALDHAIALGGDGERAGIYGFSWGGYAAGWGATFASHRFKAAVGGAGIYNWISEAGSNDTRMHEQLAHWDAPLYEHFPLYLERSPIYEIRKAKTPLLMLHGELDQSCPLGQAIEMHTAMKWKGVPVQLAIYPREGHGMRERPHQRDFLERGLGWFARYLQPSTQPPP